MPDKASSWPGHEEQLQRPCHISSDKGIHENTAACSAQEAVVDGEDVGDGHDHGYASGPVEHPGEGLNLGHGHGAGDSRAKGQQQVATEAPQRASLRTQQPRVPQALRHSLVDHLQHLVAGVSASKSQPAASGRRSLHARSS